MRSIVQRVPLETPNSSETLYNRTNAAGQATARSYGGGPTHADNVDRYDMTRDGDTGVTVTVKIRFLSQARNTTPPPTPNPAGLPELGAPSGPLAEIPVNDPDDRRTWAAGIAAGAVTAWNGRLNLIEDAAAAPVDAGVPVAGVGSMDAGVPATGGGQMDAGVPATGGGRMDAGVPATGGGPSAPPSAPPKNLKVTFASIPVFGLAEPADKQIIVHPSSTVAGTPGQPIDAGNYYVNKGGYASDDRVIAAHEYGHLIGINDEYSQNNSQLNALIHQAAPGGAPSAGPALDRASVQRAVRATQQA